MTAIDGNGAAPYIVQHRLEKDNQSFCFMRTRWCRFERRCELGSHHWEAGKLQSAEVQNLSDHGSSSTAKWCFPHKGADHKPM